MSADGQESDVARGVAKGLTLSVAAARAAIREKNAAINAIVTETEQAASRGGPLAFVPYSLKDCWDTEGVRTTGGCHRHAARVPSKSCSVHLAFTQAGAVLVGKSNVPDSSFSLECENHVFGRTSNPHDRSRTSGGSTGGGAAAVAAGMAAFDWGSDFGGSIRLPAAFCGVVGLRLSDAAWPFPRTEFFPMPPDTDVPLHGMGPLARDVASVRAIVHAVAPHLRKAGAPHPRPTRLELLAPTRASAGDWPDFLGETTRLLARADVPFAIARGFRPPEEATRVYDQYLCSRFSDFVAVSELPFWPGFRAVLRALAHRGRDKEFHVHTARILALLAVGHFTIYRNPQKARNLVHLVTDPIRAAWARGALVVTPTATHPAPKHGAALGTKNLATFVQLGNLSDATALTLPWGVFPGTRLPRGLHIMGPPGSEDAVLDVAATLERVIAS